MAKRTKFKNLAEYFKEKKYIILEKALDEESCQKLSNHLLKLVEDGKTVKDPQCPLSESIYGDSSFDELLEAIKPTIEKATGLNLIPTYTYARKYLPGDELKPHLDRASCEISATLTLGYKGKVWPIHISTDSTIENDIGAIDLQIGSMVIYRGMEINHWREKYTQGEWQCQVFLHYVDANGPHKDLKYDRRESLGKNVKKEIIMPSWNFGIANEEKCLMITKQAILSERDINQIVEYAQGKLFPAGIGELNAPATVNRSIRNVENCWLPTDRFYWLYENLEKEIRDINWINYRFILEHMENINYLEYHARTEENDDGHGHGKYSAHIDGGINTTRKLSFSILLSDPSEFEGGDLLIYENLEPFAVQKIKGAITFFPSNIIHEVTPVTKGIRRSIVSWIHGPRFA